MPELDIEYGPLILWSNLSLSDLKPNNQKMSNNISLLGFM